MFIQVHYSLCIVVIFVAFCKNVLMVLGVIVTHLYRFHNVQYVDHTIQIHDVFPILLFTGFN
jgi:hypothetical protein